MSSSESELPEISAAAIGRLARQRHVDSLYPEPSLPIAVRRYAAGLPEIGAFLTATYYRRQARIARRTGGHGDLRVTRHNGATCGKKRLDKLTIDTDQLEGRDSAGRSAESS